MSLRFVLPLELAPAPGILAFGERPHAGPGLDHAQGGFPVRDGLAGLHTGEGSLVPSLFRTAAAP